MPLELFYSYSHKDTALRDELDVHLSQLVRDGLIVPWTDRQIMAGEEWGRQIDAHVRSAHVILLLVSPDFLASDYCYGIEMKVALERHETEHAVVIPIILRPVDWRSAPFARLQALPLDAKAVTLWANRDEAFAQIARSIRDIVVRFQQPVAPLPVFTTLHDQQAPKTRTLDAAMPSHIMKDRATELLVLIRLPESEGLKGILQQDDEAEARPDDVRSKPFDVTFPVGPTGVPEPLRVSVQLTSPDFSPASQVKNIFVPVDRDSQVCPFLLTPIRAGSLMVIIELLWEDADRGYRRLKTNCVSEAEMPAAKPVLNVVQLDVGMDLSKPYPPRVQATAPAMPPVPTFVQAAATPSWLAKPFVKIGAAICVIALGSTFFWFQTPTGTATMPSAAPPILANDSGPTLQHQLTTAIVELQQVSKQQIEGKAPANTAISMAVDEGQQNITAAKVAISKGDRSEARKQLAELEAVNVRLKKLRAEQVKNSEVKLP